MRTFVKAAALAGLFALAACGGKGDDSLGDNAADAADAAADNLDAMADNTSNDAVAENLEAQADALREKGEAREDAIDRANVNAQAMTPAQKEAVTNGL
jgi:predicted small lipoprotein YifL